MTAREIDMLREFIRDEFAQVNKRLDSLGARLSPLEIERQQRIGASTAATASRLTRKERWALILAVVGVPVGFVAQVVVALIKTAPTH